MSPTVAPDAARSIKSVCATNLQNRPERPFFANSRKTLAEKSRFKAESCAVLKIFVSSPEPRLASHDIQHFVAKNCRERNPEVPSLGEALDRVGVVSKAGWPRAQICLLSPSCRWSRQPLPRPSVNARERKNEGQLSVKQSERLNGPFVSGICQSAGQLRSRRSRPLCVVRAPLLDSRLMLLAAFPPSGYQTLVAVVDSTGQF